MATPSTVPSIAVDRSVQAERRPKGHRDRRPFTAAPTLGGRPHPLGTHRPVLAAPTRSARGTMTLNRGPRGLRPARPFFLASSVRRAHSAHSANRAAMWRGLTRFVDRASTATCDQQLGRCRRRWAGIVREACVRRSKSSVPCPPSCDGKRHALDHPQAKSFYSRANAAGNLPSRDQ